MKEKARRAVYKRRKKMVGARAKRAQARTINREPLGSNPARGQF